MADHNLLGEKGENLAVHLLRQKGYTILGLNWRSGRNEVDIIASIGDTIVFVEVKTRSTDYFGDPALAVSKAKQQRTILAANAYLDEHDVQMEARFDVISIVADGRSARLQHFEDAFYPLA